MDPLSKHAVMKNAARLLGLAFILGHGTSSAADDPASNRADRMHWWREARFGMFIHWGPVSLKGTEISWSRANSNPKCPNKGNIPVDEYDNLFRKFDPVKFDADEWARIAENTGMKYVVLTAKHCDGFLLWHSKVSNYNISATPFKRDICAELADAVRGRDLKLGWYFSPMDWRDPDCRTERNGEFVKRNQGELRELLTNYGRVDVLWFDSDGRPADWHPETTYPLVRGLQPQIIINNRLEMSSGEDWKSQGKLRPNEDYYTPEQRIGAYDDQRPWETCMTLGTQWSWKPNDKIKSTAEVIGILSRTAGGDGNLLLNVGPMADGTIEPRQVEVLKGVGEWLRANGESIYGTRGGPYKPGAFGSSTRKDDVVYLHVLKWTGDTLTLPALPKKVLKASLLSGGAAKFEQTANYLRIIVAEKDRVAGDTVVKLQLEGSAMELVPVDIRE